MRPPVDFLATAFLAGAGFFSPAVAVLGAMAGQGAKRRTEAESSKSLGRVMSGVANLMPYEDKLAGRGGRKGRLGQNLNETAPEESKLAPLQKLSVAVSPTHFAEPQTPSSPLAYHSSCSNNGPYEADCS